MLHNIKINEFIPECIGAEENHFSTHCVIIIFLHFYCYSYCGEFPNDPKTLCLRRKLPIAKVRSDDCGFDGMADLSVQSIIIVTKNGGEVGE